MKKYNKTLVIGDAHADPRFSQERFTALGNFIVDQQPESIVQIGDWGNLDSISFHTKGKPLLNEGMRLSDDINSMKEAFTLTFQPMDELNSRLSKHKQKQYKPDVYWLNGNHEDRTWRYIQDKPELAGFVPTHDFVGAAERGFNVVPFRGHVYIDGVAFTHAPLAPSKNVTLSGEFICARATRGYQNSVVFGHVHHRSIHSVNRNTANADGVRVDAISAGCFFDYNPDYVRGNEGQLNWWRGLVLLTHVAPGEVDIETIDIRRLKQEYL